MTRTGLSLVFLACLLSSCASTPEASDREPDQAGDVDPLLSHAGVAHTVVAEVFLTPMTPEDNVDSPALWVDGDGKAVLLATAKASGRLMQYDGDTGALRGVVGAKGSGAGQFDRPNGIFVIDDLVFVVERDNRRVQVLRAPAMAPLGSFGQDTLATKIESAVRKTVTGDGVRTGDIAFGKTPVGTKAMADAIIRNLG